MELIGSYVWMNYSVEAYFPEPGMEDVWVIWVVKDGQVVHEAEVRAEVTTPYGIDHFVLAALERAAEQALKVAVRKAESRDGVASPDAA